MAENAIKPDEQDSVHPPERLSGPPHSALKTAPAADRHGGYSRTSIALHWVSVVLLTAFLVSLAVELASLPAILALVAAPVFTLQLIWRFARGFPRGADEPLALFFVGRLALIVGLIAMPLLAVAAIAQDLDRGAALMVFGLELVTAPVPDTAMAVMVSALAGLQTAALIAVLGAVAVQLMLAAIRAARGQWSVIGRLWTPVAGGY